MSFANEILDAIEIIVKQVVEDNATKIYTGVCKVVSTSTCSLLINGIENTVKYYGGTPTVGTVYQVFIPFGNMSAAFIIVPGAEGGGASSDVTSVNGKTGDVILTASDISALPDTTAIPDKTSDLTNDSGYITASGAPVQSVNGKTGAVSLGAGDVGALPSTTKIPSATSDLTNDSGYIISADVPVKSVNGKTGAVSLTAADVNALPSSTKIPTKTSDITNDSGYITEADVPTKTSELNNDSGFITSAALEPYAKSIDIPTKVSQLENDSDYATESQVDAKYTKPTGGIPKADLASAVQASLNKADTALQFAPVTSVNSKTGAVQLTAADVGALPSTTKIPSKTSDITNDSGFITAADVPTKVSELDNDAGYITDAALAPYAKTADIPTKTSQLTNDSNFATTAQVNAKYTKPTAGIPKTDLASGVQESLNKADTALQSAPVTSVNGKTGAVSLGASDVGAVSTANVTTTLGTSTIKVPSEKAVSDALSSTGQGDMLKSVYDPTGAVQTAGGIPDYVDSQLPTVNDATLTIQRNGKEIGTFTANASTNKSINITVPTSKSDIGLGNVDNVKQYSTSNPPPYPVTSVNGQTGAVTLGAGDIGALPLTGGTMSGVIDMNGAKITNVGTPTVAKDAANKAYADSVKGVEVLTQSAEPTTQVTGDFWFQES